MRKAVDGINSDGKIFITETFVMLELFTASCTL